MVRQVALTYTASIIVALAAQLERKYLLLASGMACQGETTHQCNLAPEGFSYSLYYRNV